MCLVERHPAAVYGQAEPELSHRHPKASRSLSTRSQTGDIRPGNDVCARPSANAAPRFAPRGLLASPAHANPASARDRVRAEPRSAGAPSLPAPLPPPFCWGTNPGHRALPASGSARHPAGSLSALTCGCTELGAERETPPGAQRAQHGSGGRESAFAGARAGAGQLTPAAHAGCPGGGARAAPMRLKT